jgi:protein-S-isoprenylcysteine O-methyltransferase Ste14
VNGGEHAPAAYGLWTLVLLNSAVFILVMFPILVMMYVRLAHREEREGAAEFGDAWRAYAARTPRWLPGLRRYSWGSRVHV